MNRFPLFAAVLLPVVLASAASGVTIRVDSDSNVRPISRYLYGQQYAGEDCYSGWCGVPYNQPVSAALLDRAADLRIQVMRQGGGNNSTKYNWAVRATGHPDYCDYQYPHDYEMAIAAIVTQFRIAAFPTVPMLGLVSGVNGWETWDHSRVQDPSAMCSGSPSKDPAFYVPTSPAQQTQRMSYLDSKLGPSAIKFWCMDNEPMIWGATHDDVFSSVFGRTKTTFMDYWTRYSNYAPAMKKQNPGILCVGPEECNEWYWFYSMTGTEGIPFYEWFIRKCADYEKRTGLRILDVLSFHFYPNTGSPVSTVLNYGRALWDPSYNYPGAGGCNSFYGTQKVQWIRRLKTWIATYFAGTPLGDDGRGIKLGLTETDFGGNPTCGLLYADFMGAFAREGLDLFTPWQSGFGGLSGGVQSQYYYTMWMYTHFWGDTSVECNVNGSYATSSLHAYASLSFATNPENISGLDKTLSVGVLNKTATNVTASLDLDLAVSTNAVLYQYKTSAYSTITTNRISNFNGTYALTFPPRSFTIVVAQIRDPVRFTNVVLTPAVISNSVSNAVRLAATVLDWDASVTNVSVDLFGLAAGPTAVMTNTTGVTSFWRCDFMTSPGLSAGLKTILLSGHDTAGYTGTALATILVRDTLAPDAPPAAPRLGRSSYSNVVISWTAATDETAIGGYLVLCGTNASGVLFTRFVPSGTAFTDRSSHQPGWTYHYRVVAVDTSSNAGPASDGAAITIPTDHTPPLDAEDFLAVPRHAGNRVRIGLSWSLPADPDRTGLLLLKSFTPVTNGPDDGWTNYAPGQALGGGVSVLAVLSSSADSFEDADAEYGDHLHYALFAFDAAANYSGGADASAVVAGPVDGTVRVLGNFADTRKGDDVCRIHFEVTGTNVVSSIAIYSLLGDKVWTWSGGSLGPGIYEQDWDLKNDDGRAVASGTYFCLVSLARKTYRQKIMVVR